MLFQTDSVPPPGHYDVKEQEKNSMLKFDQLSGDRFKDPPKVEYASSTGSASGDFTISKPKRKDVSNFFVEMIVNLKTYQITA